LTEDPDGFPNSLQAKGPFRIVLDRMLKVGEIRIRLKNNLACFSVVIPSEAHTFQLTQALKQAENEFQNKIKEAGIEDRLIFNDKLTTSVERKFQSSPLLSYLG
jgi:two-component sensor histidine kinase